MSEFETIQLAYQCKTKEEGLHYYKQVLHHHIETLTLQQIKMECVSLINRTRREMKHNELNVRVGDVCYIDYGPMYRYEAGYQHFGLVLKLSHFKAFVIPLTSNTHAITRGKDHVFHLGFIEGLTKNSMCFLNDSKFISMSRIIDVYGHLCTTDPRFIALRRKVFETIFG